MTDGQVNSPHPFRVVSRIGVGKSKFRLGVATLSRALEVATTAIETNSTEETRSGSLRSDGTVHLWKDGEAIGFVSVERYANGQYLPIGG